MEYIGIPDRGYGGFIFSTEKKAHHLQELALASIIVMTTGRVYINAVNNILLETQELLIPHLWFDYLLYTASAPDESLLTSDDTTIQQELTGLKKHGAIRFPLVTVGYDDRMEKFYETFHPEWLKLPCSDDNINGYVLKYRLARTKTENQERADLLFSNPTQAYTINTNELLQLAIGIALTVKEQDTIFPAELRSITLDCGDRGTQPNKEEEHRGSIYCATR